MAGRKLNRPTSQRLALLRNLVTDLFRYERIRTTEAKAEEARRQAEKMITLAKRGDLHARRQALAYIYDPKIVEKLFAVIAPKYVERQGGYTRIIKLGPRLGDAAPMAQIELVE
ncbi:MAG: 50S ribosomal protein L17 [Chloroflexi bacterium]|nr:50S ribosomal protein L17 [Chloroflexota bacterium]MCL5074945.1 50S ribosomal protein L17 [Chloroflexota bacterium]